MSTPNTDPATHREFERQIIEHALKLIEDKRLRVDTVRGRRAITDFVKDVTRTDRADDVKRTLSQLGKPDRELQNTLPTGETIDVLLSQKSWGVFKTPIGRLVVACVSPTRALAAGTRPLPMTRGEVQKFLSSLPPPPPKAGVVPTTVVVVVTGGVAIEAHELADRSADRTVVLAEPNDAGGWSLYGPTETKALADLFDPEAEAEKVARVLRQIDAHKADLSASGLAADRLAAKLKLPVQLVEATLKDHAKSHAGHVAKRLDGRVVLFREGVVPSASMAAGGTHMPFVQRMKTLFARKGETEKKVALLSERRAALSQQRDRAYEEMAVVESQEGALRQQFASATSDLAKRRVTSQLLQLRKDIARRQQLLGVLNQQIDVVATHLHNVELAHQGQSAQLPEPAELAADAERAEEVLANLQANAELAGSYATSAGGGLTAEEQALYDELAASAPTTAPVKATVSQLMPIEQTIPPNTLPARASTPVPSEPEMS